MEKRGGREKEKWKGLETSKGWSCSPCSLWKASPCLSLKLDQAQGLTEHKSTFLFKVFSQQMASASSSKPPLSHGCDLCFSVPEDIHHIRRWITSCFLPVMARHVVSHRVSYRSKGSTSPKLPVANPGDSGCPLVGTKSALIKWEGTQENNFHLG